MIGSRFAAALVAVALVSGCADEGSGGARDSSTPETPDGMDGCTSAAAPRERACGSCGVQYSQCAGGTWGAFGPCERQGVCAPGAIEEGSCGSSLGACRPGVRSRSCLAGCAWGEWGPCGGAGYVGPSAEICRNGVDEGCTGAADDGCSGNGIAPVLKLAGDPSRSLLYALTATEVIVYDGRGSGDARREVARIALARTATDMDLTPDGGRLVVAHADGHALSVVDVASRTVSATVAVTSAPARVEASGAGLAYYVERARLADLHRVDPGGADTVLAAASPLLDADPELSADGTSLFASVAGRYGTQLARWDVSGNRPVEQADVSTWAGGDGFLAAARRVTLSPDGHRVYYAQHQLDAHDLRFTIGSTAQAVFSEDPAGAVAIGERSLLDARTLRVLGTLPHAASEAAFATATAFAWYAPQQRTLFWSDLASFPATAGAGRRELAPQPLSSYTLTRLVRDPARPRLYGLDPMRNLVVAIDADTLVAVGAVVVGSRPSDLALSIAGDVLWVGHRETQGLARIDLATFTFGRFVPTARTTFDVEALSSGRVAVIDDDLDHGTTLAIVDGATGAELSSAQPYGAALSATADGRWLFAGESGAADARLIRYDVSAGTLVAAASSPPRNPAPARAVVALPDGSGVYYARALIDGANLATERYAQADLIRTVTPDGRLALSATRAYRVSDGAVRGTLPATGDVQAVSPDGKLLYVWAPAAGGIRTVELGAY